MMDGKKFAALLLIVAGVLALGYGGLDYKRGHHAFDAAGSPTWSADEQQHASVLIWAGIGALLTGGFLLTIARKI